MPYTSNRSLLMRDVDAKVHSKMGRTQVRLEKIIQQLFQAPKSGRLYRVPGRKVTYRASRAGEPAAIRTGAFRKSIKTFIEKVGQASYQLFAGSTLVAKYPKFLEGGTVNMKARPTFRLALERLKREVAQDWDKKD